MKKLLFFTIGFLILFTSAVFSAVTENDLQDKQSFKEYEVRIYRNKDSGEGLLKITRKGKVVFSEEGTSYRIGLIYDVIPEHKLVKMGNDITDEGQPNLVVSHWSGGAHCCFSYYVFNIGKDFKLFDVINGGDGDASKFVDVNNDGKLEFIGNDWIFSYWHESFAASPAPPIILKYVNGKYRLALDLMKKPLPADKDEKALIKEIKKEQREISKLIKEDMASTGQTNADNFAWVKNDVVLPSKVWGHMLDLIYTGHPKEAWAFLDKVWPAGKNGKEKFIADFKEQLSKSLYWDVIKIILDREIS